jgi:hypothetical protein
MSASSTALSVAFTNPNACGDQPIKLVSQFQLGHNTLFIEEKKQDFGRFELFRKRVGRCPNTFKKAA